MIEEKRKMKENLNKKYTYDEVLGSFNAAVNQFINDSQRSVGRTYSPEIVELYAEELYAREYKDVLHPYVIDQYRANYHQETDKQAKKLADYLTKLPK